MLDTKLNEIMEAYNSGRYALVISHSKDDDYSRSITPVINTCPQIIQTRMQGHHYNNTIYQYNNKHQYLAISYAK